MTDSNAPRAFTARARASLSSLLFALVLASCGGDSPTGPGGTPQPTPGTSIVLDDPSAPAFQLITATVRGIAVPVVDLRGRVGTDSMTPTRLDDSTVAFLVPDVAAGTQSIVIEFADKRLVGSIMVLPGASIADATAFTDSVLASYDFLLAGTLATDSGTVARFDSVLTAARTALAGATAAERAEVARFLAVNLQEPVPAPDFLERANAIGADDSQCTCGNSLETARTYESCALDLPAALNQAHNRVLIAGATLAASVSLLEKPRGWTQLIGTVGVGASAAILLSTVDGAFCRYAHPVYHELASLAPFASLVDSASAAAAIEGGGVFIADTARRYDVRALYRSPTVATAQQNSLVSAAAVFLDMIGEEWDALAAKVPFMPAFQGAPTTARSSTVRLVPPQYLSLGARTPTTVSGSAAAQDSTWRLTFSLPGIGNDHRFSFPVNYTGPGVTGQFGTVNATLKPARYPVKSVTFTPDVQTVDLLPQTGTTLTVTLIDSLDRELTDRVVVWTSSQDTIVSVSQSGAVWGIKEGLSTVRATSEGKWDDVIVKVEAMPVDSVIVTPDTSVIGLGGSRQLQVRLLDSLGNELNGRVVRWVSSNTNIATVDSITGVAQAVSGGYAAVIATSEGKQGHGIVRVIVGASDVSDGAAADHHCAVAVGEAAIYCWGSNSVGQLGDGTGTSSNVPVHASAVPAGIGSVVSGLEHSCGLSANGQAWCWGGNELGQIGVGTQSDYVVPAQAVAGGLSFTQLTAGTYHTCGIAVSGLAYCWGERATSLAGRTYDLVPTPVAGGNLFSELQASGGSAGTCGLTPGGTILCWGNLGWSNASTPHFSATPRAVGGGRAYSRLAVGSGHQCGVSGGDIWCWSSTLPGLNGVHDSLVNVANEEPFANAGVPFRVDASASFTDVVAGQYYSCGLTTGGGVWCWGSVETAVVVAGSAEGLHDPYLPAVPMGAGGGFTRLGAGRNSVCGLKDGGIVWCWGSNQHGQGGAGDMTGAGRLATPKPVQDPTVP